MKKRLAPSSSPQAIPLHSPASCQRQEEDWSQERPQYTLGTEG